MSTNRDPSLDTLLAFAHRLADLSAREVLKHFRMPTAVENKGGEAAFDPVTVADRAAERVIRDAVGAAWPGHGVIGEEFADTGADARYRWIIDPIDGTRAYIMGYPLWGTLIGLMDGAQPLLGMMNQPFTGERFWGAGGQARYAGPDGERDLRTRPCESLGAAILSTTHPDLFAPGFERERFETLAGQVRMSRYGGDCYAYCLLAAGHVDLVVEAGLQPFDIVALIPIIERAGGRITNWQGGPATEGGRIVAAGDARLHEAALAVLGA